MSFPAGGRSPSGTEYEETGRDRPAVILVSGWGHGTEPMASIASAFSGSCRVRSLTLAQLLSQAEAMGEAESNSRGAGGDDAPALSSYARALRNHVSGETGPVCIIGWSTGAMVAVETAAAVPEKVSGLVLLSATARFCSSDDYAPGAAPASLRAMRRRMKKDPRSVLDAFLEQASHPFDFPAGERAARVDIALAQGVEALMHGLDYLQNTDLRSSLGSIALPCLVVHGKKDRIIPSGAGEFLGRNLPRSVSEFLPDAGHYLPERECCRKAVIPRIAEFLGDVL